jgi:hypothetical protein
MESGIEPLSLLKINFQQLQQLGEETRSNINEIQSEITINFNSCIKNVQEGNEHH